MRAQSGIILTNQATYWVHLYNKIVPFLVSRRVSAITHFKLVHYFCSKKSKILKYQKVDDKPGLGIMDIISTVPMLMNRIQS